MKAIFNGGEGLKDCPKNLEEANDWINDVNKESNGEWERPEWSFDCGYKLDYDGPILRIESRFYPPKEYYGETWDGTVRISIYDKMVQEQKFDCENLKELRNNVEEYVLEIKNRIENLFKI